MRRHRWRAIAFLLGLALSCGGAAAVEDTDTPGAGRWEINLGASAVRSDGSWIIARPELDLNLGVGERVQLMAASQWLSVRNQGEPGKSGPGAGALGIKWRFMDQESAGFSLATFPQLGWNLASSSEQRGIVEPGKTLMVPLVAGIRHGALGMYAQAARTLIEDGTDEWSLGFKLLRQDCLRNVECRLELKRTLVPNEAHQTLLGAGFKWSLSESLLLTGGIGRDVGRHGQLAKHLLLQFGVQILR